MTLCTSEQQQETGGWNARQIPLEMLRSTASRISPFFQPLSTVPVGTLFASSGAAVASFGASGFPSAACAAADAAGASPPLGAGWLGA